MNILFLIIRRSVVEPFVYIVLLPIAPLINTITVTIFCIMFGFNTMAIVFPILLLIFMCFLFCCYSQYKNCMRIVKVGSYFVS